MDAAGTCPSKCVWVISVHSAGGSGRKGRGRRTCLMCAEPPSSPMCTPRSESGWKSQSGLAFGVGVTSIWGVIGEARRSGLDSRVAGHQKAWTCGPRTGLVLGISQYRGSGILGGNLGTSFFLRHSLCGRALRNPRKQGIERN